jgi:hypothetical protein
MTIGLTINQGANDDEILALKSSDVAHGMTGIAEADTWGVFKKAEATSGGLQIRGLKDADGVAGYAIYLQGLLGEAADATKTTAAVGVTQFDSRITDGGTSIASVAANGNLVVMSNGATARFIFDADGDSHQDVGTAWTNFDSEPDALITRSVGIVMGPDTIVKSKFDDWNRDHKEDLIRTGLIPRLTPEQEAAGERPLMNTTQLARLHNGAIWQLHVEQQTLREELDAKDTRIALLEQRLNLIERN